MAQIKCTCDCHDPNRDITHMQACCKNGFIEVEESKQPQNLMDGILSEMNRCRGVLKLYEEIGPAESIAGYLIKQSISAAERSLSNNDVLQMLQAYADLKTIE